jgi:hypothetical protein
MKLFCSIVLLTGLALGNIAYGQSPSQDTPPQKQSDASKVSVTGCLTKGSAAGLYTITDQKTGEKTSIAGPDQLDKYLNQTVKLTGTISGQGPDKVLKPEAVDQVAASCDKSK